MGVETDIRSCITLFLAKLVTQLEFYTITLMHNVLYIEIEEHTKNRVISHGRYLVIKLGTSF